MTFLWTGLCGFLGVWGEEVVVLWWRFFGKVTLIGLIFKGFDLVGLYLVLRAFTSYP